MIVVYCPRASTGAKELVTWLNEHGEKAQRVKGNNYLQYAPRLVVAWGYRLPVQFKNMLNGHAPIGNKAVELATLVKAGVLTPRVSGVKTPGWWARLHKHQGANDLLKQLQKGDYYVEPVYTTHEFRVHVWFDHAFRTGLKIPNRDPHHGVIRTQNSGWGLTYDQHALLDTQIDRRPIRAAAVAAVKALGYDFGAVDVGYNKAQGPIVFEVNSAPGLEGMTVERYGERIIAFARENCQ